MVSRRTVLRRGVQVTAGVGLLGSRASAGTQTYSDWEVVVDIPSDATRDCSYELQATAGDGAYDVVVISDDGDEQVVAQDGYAQAKGSIERPLETDVFEFSNTTEPQSFASFPCGVSVTDL